MEASKKDATKMFSEGKIGIFPTDTAYGIGCRMDDPKAVNKIYEFRNRPREKALLVLASTIEMASKYVLMEDDVKNKLQKYWPGGLTVILKCKKENVCENVRANGDTLAVRVPDNRELCEIIQEVGVPIVAPSANYSGQPTPLRFEDVDKNLAGKVDFVLKGMCTMEGVSTIVDATVVPWEIVRQGVVDISND